MSTRTLLKGGTVLSMDPDIGNSLDCDVLIEGTKILEVASDIVDSKAEVIDAAEMIVAPGFVDAHRHMWQGILRNSGSRLKDGGKAGLAAKFRPQDVRVSSLSSALGALDAGITTVLNFGDFTQSQEHVAAEVEALTGTGLRTMFAYPLQIQSKSANGYQAHLQALLKDKSANLYTFALASDGPDNLAIEELKKEWTQARELGLRIFTQIGMGDQHKGETLVAADHAKLLGPDVVYVHCNTLTDRELRLIHESGGFVSVAPAAEMVLGYGKPTIQRFLDLGMRPSLGVDSEAAVRGDMFTQMRSAISMQHAMSFEKKLAHKISPSQITTRDVFEFATIQGARALGMESKIGSLTPGKEADILLLKQFHINVVPVNDPIGAIVWAMDTSNVDTVFVGGKILKRGGELLNVDLPRLREQTAQSSQHLLDAVAA